MVGKEFIDALKNKHKSNSQSKNISKSVNENISFIKTKLGDSIGLSEGKFKAFKNIDIGIVYVTNLCDREFISNQVISPLLQGTLNSKVMKENDVDTLAKTIFISSLNTKEIKKQDQVLNELLKGNTVIFFEKSNSALIVQAPKIEKRSIDKPENETAVFAAKDAFIEDIGTNVSMIIKRLPIPNLKFENFSLGNLSHTDSKLIWIEGLADNEIVNEVKRRMNDVNIDIVDGTSTLAELIQDKPISIFPTYRLTERPDLVSRSLSEGHVAVVCDNSPFVLILPMTFWDNFKSMDDYSQLPIAASLLRIIRIIAFVIAGFTSPLYLSFVTYNHTIVPPSLALNISQGREGVPFPSIIELIAMTVVIDIIREAGTRMPGMVGYFIGTLGAVIIGQAAVAAGYVSVSLIIVVAFSAIASFAISSTTLVNAARIINYSLILFASVLGIVGLFNGIFIILWRMSILESFGVPYLYPLIPVELKGWRDLLIRAPFKMLKNKLTLMNKANSNESKNEEANKIS
ncbi:MULTISPECIES: spore germination protein [Clostridium]|uniref:spore germination protein n=1 Tax=Clostridium TaxID=1485 RepID=UPI0009BC9CA2|nr:MULTISPECIES: spore germination protein [Clostridium]PJI08597.1 spore germination protein [Clostridium sp. CT7]